ncbi:very short patch repair endonuclease [Chloroflexus aggregans]|uniref:DNA mismatch endonuclease Vsr n=1 Tax=Chloroflexus aggregans (strain MD-66 / DSM 9485) TaxID=326427 RepID=B8G3L1_CHLAD|nr:very short patch repair endonuclease [Chloroflexus aggregans]ACL23394.1 DNA mismatch endonuclease Vsr [Chloroflexus aggregans DSM 9485]
MSDNLSPQDRHKTMQAVKGKGTRLEKRLWAMLAGLGLKGWKKNADNIVGKPDVAFLNQRIAIFIDGCFWHGCPYCKRKLPKTNREYWERKINRNIELARLHDEQLQREGWIVIRIWEHEMADIEKVRARIRNLLSDME